VLNIKRTSIYIVFSLAFIFWGNYALAKDYRDEIGSSLLTAHDGSFDYRTLEAILNIKFGKHDSSDQLKQLITQLNGNCNENGCNLPISSKFCAIEKAIITVAASSPNKYLVESFTDGC
jgi:hypothetical protein